MATVAISTPLAGTPISTPFDLSGTCTPATAQVEVRGENGLLVPATANPVPAIGGNWTVHITGLIGTIGASYSAGNGIIEVINSITYPADGQTVSSPVTYTGMATSGDLVELRDTAQYAVYYPLSGATVFSPITFTGTSTPSSVVELWDTAAVPLALTHKVQAVSAGQATPGTVTATGANALTTTGASLIIISVQANGGTGSRTFSSVTVGGNAATYRQRSTFGPSSDGLVEVWTYWSSASLSAVDVVGVYAGYGGNASGGIIVTEATGTSSSGVGANGTNGGTSATPSVAVTSTATSSVIYGTLCAWNGNTGAGANTTALGTELAANDASNQSAYNTETVTSGNAYTVAMTCTSGYWGMVGLEIKAA
jgi:hypothetical protein